MPKKPKNAGIPLLPEDESELVRKMNQLIEKNNELDRRLSVMEEKLEDLAEQFAEEFGEELEDEKEEKEE